jgi:hypothetical protein
LRLWLRQRLCPVLRWLVLLRRRWRFLVVVHNLPSNRLPEVKEYFVRHAINVVRGRYNSFIVIV